MLPIVSARAIVAAPWFRRFITGVIVVAAVVVGVETDARIAEEYHGLLMLLDRLILAIFVAEIALKMVAESPRPWRFFRDPWNNFDFVIVAACFIPGIGQYALVARLLRLLRVLRLLTTVPRLQIIVGALMKSIPSMFYVSMLLFLLFYVYAVAGVFLFAENDPIHFRSLPISLLSLFRVVTLEDWTDIMYIQMYGCAAYGYGPGDPCTASNGNMILGAAYFVSFVMVGTMVVLNLFIGVIMTGMSEAQAEAEDLDELRRRDQQGVDSSTVEHELFVVLTEIDALHARVTGLKRKLEMRLDSAE